MNRKKNVDILAIIPCRSGSKTISHKNVRRVAGKPLIGWSIEHAIRAKTVNRVVVSTDSGEYAEIARDFGAETPFLRPAKYAGDLSTDLDVFDHALEWLRENEGYVPDICVHLRPTAPVRDPETIDAMVDILVNNTEYDSVRTVAEVVHPPFKMWYRAEDGGLRPVVTVEGIDEPWNEPRQNLPTTYIQTASIDVVRTETIVKERSMTGQRIYGYVESDLLDIDTESELAQVAGILSMEANPIARRASGKSDDRRVFCFDIDGVVATITEGNDYSKAGPMRDTIRCINELFEMGHYIVLFTARGSATGIDWSGTTAEQMQQWGVRYHELRFGKPPADYYIDDKLISLEDIDSTTQKLRDEAQPKVNKK